MSNSLGKKFSFWQLIMFAMPNIIMMIFMSLYTIVDGIFVSRFVGTLALSAVNMVYPVNCLEMAIGIMLATGGSAVIAIRMGEKKEDKARENFTFILLVSFLTGIFICIAGNIFINQILECMGVSALQFTLCKSYMRILLFFAPAFFLQTAFQILFVTAGKPKIGLAVTVLAGITNMVLDYVFIVELGWGIGGAAAATGIGYCIPAVFGLVYFALCKKGSLYFTKFKADWQMLIKSCTNGASEMVTNVANAVTTFLFNYIFMKYYGEDGVASITIVLYFQFVFTAVYFGFSMGVAPIISYKYGGGETVQLKKIFRNSLLFTILCSAASYTLSLLLITPALRIFTDSSSNVFAITVAGFPVYAIGFLFMGIGTFASAYFTALSDGKTSAIISFARTFLFLAGGILILPVIIGEKGIWLAVPAAELLGLFVSVFYLVKKRIGKPYKK